MSVVSFDALPSRTPMERRRTMRRIDPYWGSLWRTGSTESWWSRKDAARLIHSGALGGVPAPLRVRTSEAWSRIDTTIGREKAMRLVAALDQWRTMTAEQAEALTGVSGVDIQATKPWMASLWAADLIDFAVVANALTTGWSTAPARLLRPARPSSATRRFEEMLTWPEWVSVTAGTGLEQNRQFDRHNVLATEFGLRCAEFGNVAMVFGEKLSSFELLAYTGRGKTAPAHGHPAADLTLVRPDGACIAIEMTASKVGPWMQSKVDRHCEALQRNPMNESGLSVVFVNAPHQDASVGEVTNSLNVLKKLIARGVRAYPGTYDSPTAQRIGIASWSRLFPAAHEVADDFPRLPVDRPTGRGYLVDGSEEVLWETAYMLDPADLPFAPANPSAATAVIDNAAGLRGVPHFLRRGTGRPKLYRESMRAAGLDPLPVIEGAFTEDGAPIPRLRY